jgi:hypothetical protein
VTRKALRAGAEPAALMELACACASARQAARAITQLYDRWLDGTGLEAAQFALLMAVNGHRGREPGGYRPALWPGQNHDLAESEMARTPWIDHRHRRGRRTRAPVRADGGGPQAIGGRKTQVEEGARITCGRDDQPAVGHDVRSVSGRLTRGARRSPQPRH